MTFINVLDNNTELLQEAVLFKREFGTAGEKIANLIKDAYTNETGKELEINEKRNQGAILKKTFSSLNDKSKDKISQAVFPRASILNKDEKRIILEIIIDNSLSSALGIKDESKFDNKDQDTIKGNVSDVRGVDLFSVNQKSFVTFFAERAAEAKADPVRLFINIIEAKTRLNNKKYNLNKKQEDLIKYFFNLNNKMSTNKFMSKLFKLGTDNEKEALKKKDEASEFISNFIDNKDSIGNYDFNKNKKVFRKDRKIEKEKEISLKNSVKEKETENPNAYIDYKKFRKTFKSPESFVNLIGKVLNKDLEKGRELTKKEEINKETILKNIETSLPNFFTLNYVKKIGIKNVLPNMYKEIKKQSSIYPIGKLILKEVEKTIFEGGKVSAKPYKMRGQAIDIKSGLYARVQMTTSLSGNFKNIYQTYYTLKERAKDNPNKYTNKDISLAFEKVRNSLHTLLTKRSRNGVMVYQSTESLNERVIIKTGVNNEYDYFKIFFNKLDFDNSGKTIIKYKMSNGESVSLITFSQGNKLIFSIDSLYKIAKAKDTPSIVIGKNEEADVKKGKKKPIDENLKVRKKINKLIRQING